MKCLFIQNFDDNVPGHSRKVVDYYLLVEGRHYEPTTKG
jgi:hypothetical protein